jgi:hypothetical protein
MAEKKKDEELIDKLIKKRKEENDAFMKLLSAIEKGTEPKAKEKTKGKPTAL